MAKRNNKQVTVKVPMEVYQRARAEATAGRHMADGRKLLPTAVMRRWMLLGMEAAVDATVSNK